MNYDNTPITPLIRKGSDLTGRIVCAWNDKRVGLFTGPQKTDHRNKKIDEAKFHCLACMQNKQGGTALLTK
jgi:hypothetical protein